MNHTKGEKSRAEGREKMPNSSWREKKIGEAMECM